MGRKKNVTGQDLLLALITLLFLFGLTYFFVENETIVIEEIGNALPGLNSVIKKLFGILIASILW